MTISGAIKILHKKIDSLNIDKDMEDYIAYGLAIEALEKMEEYFLLKFKVREGELEEVVRCGDCKFYDFEAVDCSKTKIGNMLFTPEDYCSFGEKAFEETEQENQISVEAFYVGDEISARRMRKEMGE